MKERDKSPREEYLQIRNFGPIHEADITIRDLTIFVGPQATGKSLAAQALYFLRRVEKLLLDNSATSLESTLSALVLPSGKSDNSDRPFPNGTRPSAALGKNSLQATIQ